MSSLEGKMIVVTGGGCGIARACGLAGANVVITGRTIEPLEETGPLHAC